MKIFNVEKGIKKVYVQLKDITMLAHTDMPIATSISEKAFSELDVVNNRMNFIEFSQPEEVEFFKSIDWIVDYKRVKDLSKEECRQAVFDILGEINTISQRFNDMSFEEKNNNQQLMQRYNLLYYKMKCLIELLQHNNGCCSITLPIVPDSDGFVFSGDETCNYELAPSLDPNQLLIFRKDGERLSKDDVIPQNFIQMGLSIAMLERSQNSSYLGDYEIDKFISGDSKYLIIQFASKNTKNQNNQKGINKLVKKLFNRKIRTK